jgi:hypothetical protein
VFPETQVWVADTLGLYDVLLLSGVCGTPDATIVAAFDAGTEPGFGVGADPIPAGTRAGWLVLLALVAFIAVWMLWARRG